MREIIRGGALPEGAQVTKPTRASAIVKLARRRVLLCSLPLY